ncbi:hypothetical protein SDC9_147290 [bioreactor metagenome]|uniref:Uncharacterized protein n=1 Tax=bioreactor metagenome TaxID=1076179 RepID=A0A645EFA8_9ZZZZ
MDVHGDLAIGELLDHFLELQHSVLVGVLLGCLVMGRNQLQGSGLHGQDENERKNGCKEQYNRFFHIWYPFRM